MKKRLECPKMSCQSYEPYLGNRGEHMAQYISKQAFASRWSQCRFHEGSC